MNDKNYNWVNIQYKNLKSGDFLLLEQEEANFDDFGIIENENPNFSSKGEELYFGYVTENSSNLEKQFQSISGIGKYFYKIKDNFKISIYTNFNIEKNINLNNKLKNEINTLKSEVSFFNNLDNKRNRII
jgi:hypothetical protein